MLSAVQAILNTAVGNQHAITVWKYAESLLCKATDQSLSAKGTMRYLAEYLGKESTSYKIPCWSSSACPAAKMLPNHSNILPYLLHFLNQTLDKDLKTGACQHAPLPNSLSSVTPLAWNPPNLVTLVPVLTASSATPDCFIIDNTNFLDHFTCTSANAHENFTTFTTVPLTSSTSGETLYGFCVGNSIAAAIDTDNIAMVQSASSWHSHDSALCYSKFAVVAAAALADNAMVNSTCTWLLSQNEFSVFS
ncbi:hypothetical protein HDU80_005762 [Chytriomyces hyalinus]|nr:hypothetical protein HDU80_005762 [Chytriomyces hyalinus]